MAASADPARPFDTHAGLDANARADVHRPRDAYLVPRDVGVQAHPDAGFDFAPRHLHLCHLAHQHALQQTFKILINAFYGYLAFGSGHFNDFAAADRVTTEGRRIVTAIVAIFVLGFLGGLVNLSPHKMAGFSRFASPRRVPPSRIIAVRTGGANIGPSAVCWLVDEPG